MRIVEMGPFKHKVDDGLELRKVFITHIKWQKACYECLLSSIDAFTECTSNQALTQTLLLRGLNDPSQDVKVLAHLILAKFTLIRPDMVLESITEIIGFLKSDITAVVKPNAVKQEIERLSELIKSAARVARIIEGIDPKNPEIDVFIKTVVRMAK